MMRWYVLKTLLHKELLRLLNNKGGLAMSAVMIFAAVLAAVFGDTTMSTSMVTGQTQCVVDYWQDGGWVEHLKDNVPDHLAGRISFRSLAGHEGTISYPLGAVGIQLRPVDHASEDGVPPEPGKADGSPSQFKVWVWYPDPDGAAAAPFEIWFWQESWRFFSERAGGDSLAEDDTRADDWQPKGADADFWQGRQRSFRDRLAARLKARGTAEAMAAVPQLRVERSRMVDRRVNLRAGAAMFLVLMALFFVCIFLMPSATAEERERGALLAQALSPASSLEILGAKLLFYPALAVGLASLVAGICRPEALALPFFWLALGITALGTVGIGLTLSVLARTQRAASMSALSYMLAVALILIICRTNGFELPAAIMLENHGPEMLLAALNDSVKPSHWGQLAISWVLAVVWCGLATALFRRFGWQ